MDNEEKKQSRLEDEQQEMPGVSGYNCKQLLDLLSIYEGELQARDALIDSLQQQQCSSSQLTSSSATTTQSTVLPKDALDALFRDSLLAESDHAIQCAACGSKLLHTAKTLQVQRDCDRKINKVLNLLNKRHIKIVQELEAKERRVREEAKEEQNYIKLLENERSELLEQLKKRQSEFAELEEQKSKLQDQFEESTGREKQIVLLLLNERQHLMAHIQELAGRLESPRTGSEATKSTAATTPDDSQFRALREENRRLQQHLNAVQTEKNGLQKRLDYLLKDLQQSAFHHNFQFLQPKNSTNEKELIVIGNGLLPPQFPPPPLPESLPPAPHRIRNSSSFPQTLGGDDHTASSRHGRMPQQFPVSQVEQRHFPRGSHENGGGGSAVPLMASQSTTVMRRPPPVPRTSAQPHSQQQMQHYRRPGPEQANSAHGFLGQPQTVITRRSTSLPRRIISSSTAMPMKQQMGGHRREPSAEHFFYHQQPQGAASPLESNASNNFI